MPWDIHPQEFLQFAEIDLAGHERHRLVNGLANAKRAMECQGDSLLLAYGLFYYAKKQRWGLPKKLEVLQELGIVAPRILNKINSERNLLEHEGDELDIPAGHECYTRVLRTILTVLGLVSRKQP